MSIQKGRLSVLSRELRQRNCTEMGCTLKRVQASVRLMWDSTAGRPGLMLDCYGAAERTVQ